MSDVVIGAFSEEQVERLTGVSVTQLRGWNRTDFFKPAYSEEDSRLPYSRAYSFRDLVSLRVLNQLRNVHKVSMPELRKAADRLQHLGSDAWSKAQLWVLNRKVVVQAPGEAYRRELTSDQYVADIPLSVVISDTKAEIRRMNERGADQVGHVEQRRRVVHNVPVIAGTRIPVSVVRNFADAGYSTDDIIAEYPDLTREDVDAALTFTAGARAA